MLLRYLGCQVKLSQPRAGSVGKRKVFSGSESEHALTCLQSPRARPRAIASLGRLSDGAKSGYAYCRAYSNLPVVPEPNPINGDSTSDILIT